ncbi:MAG TPA: hypothetical protein DCY36_00415 [Acidimicrobiaceae bacterium]|nr:hypothetical protein [Acidimicrobiales bacterium]HAY64465.1 hypothetical protein [Acidimicrobiaceae bacterium]HBV25718.1 hypothetical protein [Acidimicrobiaceae bacterium]
MTEAQDVTISIPENVNEAVSIVDRALGSFMHRELVSASEVTDVLLDIRSALNKAHTEADEVTLDLSDVESEMEVSA